MSPKPMTTLGFERKHNPLLNDMPFDEFRQTMTAGFQVRPMGFSQIVTRNQEGPAALSSLREVRRLSMGEIEKLQTQGDTLVDVRHATAFGASFIPGSINIGLTPQSATWLGMVVETKRNLIIICDNEADALVATGQFRRVGFDNILGFLDGGVSAWAAAAKPLDHLPQLSVQSLKHVLKKYTDHVILDVRTEQEWERGHIDKAIHKPIADLVREGIDFDNKQQHVTAICGSGYRSNIAGSFLKSKGYEQVFSVIGGMTAWERMHRI
jgi:rhodanese-related sulfurtransferase